MTGIMRTHFSRWFAGAAKGDSQMQTKMIVNCANGVMAENAKRSKAKKVSFLVISGTYDN